MMNPTAPIIGGANWPPVEATASTAPANSARYPVFFISGMVIAPVVATLASALPLIMPIRALAMTDTLAGPPAVRPTSVSARSLMKSLKPLYFRKAPNSTNRKM